MFTSVMTYGNVSSEMYDMMSCISAIQDCKICIDYELECTDTELTHAEFLARKIHLHLHESQPQWASDIPSCGSQFFTIFEAMYQVGTRSYDDLCLETSWVSQPPLHNAGNAAVNVSISQTSWDIGGVVFLLYMSRVPGSTSGKYNGVCIVHISKYALVWNWQMVDSNLENVR